MATHATIDEFITHEILPILGDYEDDFDVRSIAFEVSEYDGRGFVWKDEYKGPDNIEALNAVLQAYDVSGK